MAAFQVYKMRATRVFMVAYLKKRMPLGLYSLDFHIFCLLERAARDGHYWLFRELRFFKMSLLPYATTVMRYYIKQINFMLSQIISIILTLFSLRLFIARPRYYQYYNFYLFRRIYFHLYNNDIFWSWRRFSAF